MSNHARIMSTLMGEHAVIASLIGTHRIHYVDVPVHRNIGDLLIMLGTLRFFERQGISIGHKAAYFGYRSRWAHSDDVIVFNGGGNLGDLYEGPQQAREAVIHDLPRNRIIILPQTIHFRSQRAYDACCQIFSQHPDLHICVRDHASHGLALPMSRHVYLLPNMAHQLWPIRPSRTQADGHLALLRSDLESAGSVATNGGVHADWRELVGRRNTLIRLARGILGASHAVGLAPGLQSRELDLWIRYAARLVDDILDFFGKFGTITTDRLHAHLLACLMGIPGTVLDNSYGKNHSYVAAWTGASDIVRVEAEGTAGSLGMLPHA
jgi:pyruvyl transferase EpsO